MKPMQLFLILMIALLIAVLLPSCAGGAGNTPVRFGLVTNDGTLDYSSKSGLAIVVDATSGK